MRQKAVLGVLVSFFFGAWGLLTACGDTRTVVEPCSEAGVSPIKVMDSGADVRHSEAGSETGPKDAGLEASDSSPEDAALDAAPDAPEVSLDASRDVDIDALFNVFPAQLGFQVYSGGPILVGPVHVYFLWYGDWSSSPAPAILEDMLHGLSGDAYQDAAPYDDIVQAYCGVDADGGTVCPTGRIQFAGSYYLGYPAGMYLGLGNDENMVANAITFGTVPYDPTAVYFIMTSSDVEEDLGSGDGFCTNYCAYHNAGQTNDLSHRPFQYAFVGDPMQCPDLCTMRPEYFAAGVMSPPNGDWASDSMASNMAHELFESMVDPVPYTGWFNPFNKSEIGDVCGWRFDPVYQTDAGSYANVHWGDRDFLIQQLWTLDDAGGHCDLHP